MSGDRAQGMTGEGEERFRGYYTQPLEVLDLAWERLYAEDVVRDGRRPFKTARQVMSDQVGPPDISHIIDVAVTAWRWRGVPSGRFRCTYCGDGTEVDEDPDPRVCRMCVKLPGRACAP